MVFYGTQVDYGRPCAPATLRSREVIHLTYYSINFKNYHLVGSEALNLFFRVYVDDSNYLSQVFKRTFCLKHLGLDEVLHPLRACSDSILSHLLRFCLTGVATNLIVPFAQMFYHILTSLDLLILDWQPDRALKVLKDFRVLDHLSVYMPIIQGHSLTDPVLQYFPPPLKCLNLRSCELRGACVPSLSTSRISELIRTVDCSLGMADPVVDMIRHMGPQLQKLTLVSNFKEFPIEDVRRQLQVYCEDYMQIMRFSMSAVQTFW